jgi:hypothetical protein
MITDAQYVEFLWKLANDQARPNGLLGVTDWEQEFLRSFVRSSRPSLWITTGRRPVVDRMWRRLGPDLGWPHPLDTVTTRPAIPKADPTGCEYLVRGDDGRQRRCNEPAVVVDRNPPRLRYCELHKAHVEKRFPGIKLAAIG